MAREDILIVDESFDRIPAGLTSACLLAANGLFHVRRLNVRDVPFAEVCERVGPGWPAPGMQVFEGERGLKFYAPRIPRQSLLQVEAFFRAVYAEHRGEAVVFLYFSPHGGGEWRFMAPEQEVSGDGLSWESPGPPPRGWYLAGSFHSHGGMSAFHSGTDDSDELDRDGIHVTVGKIASPHPEYAASVVIGGQRVEIDIEDIVELAEAVEFPSQWLDRVRKPAPVVVATRLVPGRGGKRKLAGWYSGWCGGGYDE